ncbi:MULTISPECIES: molybdopterin cofactor-binding domain-containing protein [unclassified Cupriavidus]|uniref:xanthine dehydrogenase family protein molybdopterin-binding subunit n=1 Tax=unclassified Cupriavidus TaxID=2640874 RepID=UPI001C005B91|nr:MULTISPECIES: molybdopterin cofactor-binding domain-containing protein [unclassified Cupriavidus]MCA3185049.1 molybdopterin-dependent oxidoreductase [Cupriavidus sp.]MCA3192357.1 molybdopterin-dependent oxidoreductase [Cupriavidus sp.]MCA3196132.1 molybdopterin-dependent oxidoreductase [Cupriavidus sp.]MCA3203665.1 molybdopterin-dependent oxidoreductase [Cupriavidus sp.]MCA3206249.1 molybdopterin-dependent oxidoreductase [Cupriavidus sp.]
MTHAVIGHSVKRTDLLDKVTGNAKYVADMPLAGLLHAKMKRCNVAHARIRRIDTAAALALPGVKAILTHENVPRVLHAGSPHPRSASVTCDQYILDDKVRYWGEGVAAVAATSEDIAARAVELIEVEYEPLPALFTVDEAAAPGAPLIHDREPGGNLVLPPVRIERGDVDKGFAEADFILEGVYEGGRPTPAYMEPNVLTCKWDGNGNLTVWISTQTAFMVRGIMAEVLGLPLHKVRVLVDHMGGGFGAKQDLFQSEFLCALLARETHRPVRMEYTREETFLGGRTRHPARVWLRQGFRNDGTITAREAKVVFNSGAYGSHGPGVTNVGTAAMVSLYRCENVRLEGRCVYTNSPIAGAFRGYGVVQTYYALDIQMDEAAERLGMDPAELKLRNAVREGDIAPSNHPLIGRGLEACIARGMEAVDWKARRLTTRQQQGVIRRGWGVGCEMHGSSAYPGIKEQGNAIVKMNEDGTVVLLTGAAGLGTGAHTALAQIVAEEMAIPFESVSVVHGDTDVVPWDIGAFASHTTYMVGRAAQMAAGEIKTQLLARAAKQMEAEPDALDIADGVISVRGRQGPTLTVREAVMPRKGLPAAQFVGTATYHPTKSYSFAAHFVEVEVDTETGFVTVKQVVPVHDIGKVIHPVGAAGQIEGGIQQGIGHTLYEDYQIDMQTGRSLNANFVDYKMPLAMDMPEIRTILLEAAPDPGGPFGAKGVGEDPIVAIGPAIANAVFDAIGVRFRHYPIKPEQVLQALAARRAAEARP